MGYSITDLYNNNFNQFNNLSSVRKNNQIEKIKYIENVARSLDLNISSLDLNLFLPTLEDNSISASPREINRILANLDLNEIQNEQNSQLEGIEITSRQLGALKSAATRFRNRALRQKEEEFNRLKRDITSYYSRANDLSVRALSLRRELDNNRTTFGQDYVDQVERLIATGNFILESVGTNEIKFITRNDIINTFRNANADINLRVNLGKFLITVNYENLNLRVTNYSNNVNAGGYIHPHIGTAGMLCLGNISELFSEAKVNGDIFTMLDLTHKLLVNYNDANPYVSLAAFAAESGQIQPNGEVLEVDEDL